MAVLKTQEQMGLGGIILGSGSCYGVRHGIARFAIIIDQPSSTELVPSLKYLTARRHCAVDTRLMSLLRLLHRLLLLCPGIRLDLNAVKATLKLVEGVLKGFQSAFVTGGRRRHRSRRVVI